MIIKWFSFLLPIAMTLMMSVAAHSNDLTPTAGTTLLLTSVPVNTPKDATIYVTGSFNNWQTASADYKLTAKDNGQYAVTLPASVHGKIDFKFTLGSWDLAELDTNGGETPNRNFVVPDTGVATYSGTVAAWHLPAQSIAELKLELEKILADTHTPGMSVAIVRKDGPEWIAGLGKADVASDRAATADTLFRIGSVSKAFAGLAILKLEQEGKLSLQDPVRKLAPDVWFENRWEETDPVRVVDLLEHTTGWDDMHMREYAMNAPDMKLGEALDYDHSSRTSRWKPGTRMSYCNSGPAVAALIVEKITGQRFEDYVTQHFFQPIGMKTATYFQPTAEQTTTLYQKDGKTPYPYWNILFRPAGSINASANDMAAYLSFYLHRGDSNGTPIMPSAAIDRMEVPTRNWAAREGLNVGYGVYNYATVDDGMVYHGHEGGVEGGLTSAMYLPDQGVGYFYSINSGNGVTFQKVHHALRAYIARGLAKPVIPAAAELPAGVEKYTGWYEPASPRVQNLHFFERLLGIGKVSIKDGKLHATGFMSQQTLIPVEGKQFRSESDPIATVVLITPNTEGLFIVNGGRTMKHIPTWIAFIEIGLASWFVLALILTTIYAPFWLFASLLKKWRKPQEFWIKLCPLVAVLSICAIFAIFYFVSEDMLMGFGKVSVWSLSLCLATLVFAVAAIASAVILWITRKNEIRKWVYIHSVVVSIGLLIAVIYLSYWGFIGIRTWA